VTKKKQAALAGRIERDLKSCPNGRNPVHRRSVALAAAEMIAQGAVVVEVACDKKKGTAIRYRTR
jgi:hypothetical protein